MSKNRINITVDDELLEKIDEYSKKMHQTRSGFFAMCADNYITQQITISHLPEMLEAYKEITK